MSAPSRAAWPVLGALLALAASMLEPLKLAPALSGSWFFDATRLATLQWAVAGAGVAIALVPQARAWLARDARPLGPERGSRGTDALFVVALGAMALALEWRSGPISKDTKFYLGEALDIAERGGLVEFVGRCLDGSWTEDNRHPLYLMLIAPWAERSNAMLAASKLVSFSGAALTLLAVLRACRRRGGELAALAAGTLLVTNAAFVEHSILTACESWWTLFAVLALDLVTRDDDTPSSRRWPLAGLCLGLAFLTKGTGLLLALAVGIAVLWNQRRTGWRSLLPLAVGFVAAGGLLLVRNQRRFGDAFFNVNSRRALWLDSWKQFQDPDALASASMSTWFERHSLGDAAARLGSGIVKQAAHTVEAASPIAPGGVGALLATLVVALLVVGILRLSNRRERAVLGLVVVAWIASFSWYASIASDRRFLAVLLPLLTPALATWTSRATPAELPRLKLALASCTALSAVVALAFALPFARPLGFRESTENRELHAWLLERESEGRDVVYLLGPSSTLGFDWDRTLLATRAPRPLDDRMLDALLSTPEGERVRYLVVELGEPGTRAGAEWIGEPGAAPAPWTLAAGFPRRIPSVLVFERRPPEDP